MDAESLGEQPPIVSSRFELERVDQQVVGEIQVVQAKYEDTFVDIARAYNLGFDELVQANPDVDPWLPGDGTPIVLPTQFVLPHGFREGIVLNIASKRLFYYPPSSDDQSIEVITYPIGIGKTGWATPTGETTVISKARDPIWYVPASVRKEHAEAGDPLPRQVPPGPDNPLGKRVLGLGIPGYLIHGTNKPAGVGMRVSHGCVRLFPENIEWLYEQVEIGESVTIIDEPYLVGWREDDLVLEAHPPLAEDERDVATVLSTQIAVAVGEQSRRKSRIDDDRVQNIADAARGFPVSILDKRPDTVALVRSARRVSNIAEFEE